MVRQKVLIVDSDKNFCNYLSSLLSANEYEPMEAHSVEAAMGIVSSHCPDLTILNPELPDMDGMRIISAVRAWSLMPIILLTEQKEESRKVKAMDSGADDYIVKPCGDEELLARMRMAFRHTRMMESNLEFVNKGIIRIGDLLIDYNKYRVYVDGVDARLTQNEYRMVAMLAKYAGNVITYEKIMRELWGPNSDEDDNQILRVNMTNIRRKLGTKTYIYTENGVGYRMINNEEFEEEQKKAQ